MIAPQISPWLVGISDGCEKSWEINYQVFSVTEERTTSVQGHQSVQQITDWATKYLEELLGQRRSKRM